MLTLAKLFCVYLPIKLAGTKQCLSRFAKGVPVKCCPGLPQQGLIRSEPSQMALIAVLSHLEVFLIDLREKLVFLHWGFTCQLQKSFFLQKLLCNRLGEANFQRKRALTFMF